jgi:peptide deformylase
MSIFDIITGARKMRIVRNGNRSLRGISMPIGEINDEVKSLARRMIVTMKENDVPGVGLAAPQVGVNLRLIVVDTRPDGKSARKKPLGSPGEMMLNPLMPVALVNPEIISSSKETECMGEGCLSLPGVEGEVTRPKRVMLKAQLLDGEQIMLECDGLLARCLQHEIDHLNGILFIDRASEEERLAAKPIMEEMAAAEAKLAGK